MVLVMITAYRSRHSVTERRDRAPAFVRRSAYARYFFNIKDGRISLDNEGTELADIQAARKEAVTFSGTVLRDGAGESLWAGQPWQLWSLTNQAGRKHVLHPELFRR
jgi:hypothetical protein